MMHGWKNITILVIVWVRISPKRNWHLYEDRSPYLVPVNMYMTSDITNRRTSSKWVDKCNKLDKYTRNSEQNNEN